MEDRHVMTRWIHGLGVRSAGADECSGVLCCGCLFEVCKDRRRTGACGGHIEVSHQHRLVEVEAFQRRFVRKSATVPAHMTDMLMGRSQACRWNVLEYVRTARVTDPAPTVAQSV